MKSEVISNRIIVPATANDIRGHVNNLVYLEWCLDAAEAHWMSKSTESLRQKYVWYVIEHNIQYRASAFEGDELELKTWIDSTQGQAPPVRVPERRPGRAPPRRLPRTPR